MGGEDYSQSQVNKWTASIVERCLTQLVKQGKPYKFIGTSEPLAAQMYTNCLCDDLINVFVFQNSYSVTCAVMQKTGAGLHTANSCYWDTSMDGNPKISIFTQSIFPCVLSKTA